MTRRLGNPIYCFHPVHHSYGIMRGNDVLAIIGCLEEAGIAGRSALAVWDSTMFPYVLQVHTTDDQRTMSFAATVGFQFRRAAFVERALSVPFRG